MDHTTLSQGINIDHKKSQGDCKIVYMIVLVYHDDSQYNKFLYEIFDAKI